MLTAPIPALTEPKERCSAVESRPYCVIVEGSVGELYRPAFDGLMMCSDPVGHTSLIGVMDQDALFAVIARVQALALVLVEVQRLSPGDVR